MLKRLGNAALLHCHLHLHNYKMVRAKCVTPGWAHRGAKSGSVASCEPLKWEDEIEAAKRCLLSVKC